MTHDVTLCVRTGRKANRSWTNAHVIRILIQLTDIMDGNKENEGAKEGKTTSKAQKRKVPNMESGRPKVLPEVVEKPLEYNQRPTHAISPSSSSAGDDGPVVAALEKEAMVQNKLLEKVNMLTDELNQMKRSRYEEPPCPRGNSGQATWQGPQYGGMPPWMGPGCFDWQSSNSAQG